MIQVGLPNEMSAALTGGSRTEKFWPHNQASTFKERKKELFSRYLYDSYIVDNIGLEQFGSFRLGNGRTLLSDFAAAI